MSLHSSDVQQGLYFGGGVGTSVIAVLLVLASMFIVKNDASKKIASLVALFLSFAGNIMLLILIYSHDPIPNMDLAIAQTVTIGLLLIMVIFGLDVKFKSDNGATVSQPVSMGNNLLVRCSNITMIHGSAILMIAVQLNLLLLYKPFVELY
jgi:hypothetical protein